MIGENQEQLEQSPVNVIKANLQKNIAVVAVLQGSTGAPGDMGPEGPSGPKVSLTKEFNMHKNLGNVQPRLFSAATL